MGVISTTLSINTRNAQKSLNAVITRMTRINELAVKMGKRVDFSGASFTNIERQVNSTTNNIIRQRKEQDKVTGAVKKTSDAQNRLNQAAKQLNAHYSNAGHSASLLGTKLRRLASIYLGVMGAKAALTSADTFTGATNKFNSIGIDSRDAMDKVYQSSLASYSGYADNLSNVAKMMTNAGKAFDGNVDAAIRFNEIMQKSYVLGGASAAEQASSMYQLVQALGSGTLQGDELRSVREGAPQAYAAIEEFAQGVYGADKSLKELASQGVITSDMVVQAMFAAGDSIDEAFKNTDMTFAQLWTNFKTQALRAFQPVLEKMREFMNSDKFKQFVNNLVSVMASVASIVGWAFEQFVNIFNFISDNWNWISKILIAVVAVLATIVAYHTAIRIAAFLTALAEMTIVWPLLIALGVLFAIVAVFLMFPGVVSGVVSFVAAIIVDAVLVIWSLIVMLVAGVVNLVISAVEGIINLILAIAQTIMNIALVIWNTIVTIVGAIAGSIAALGAAVGVIANNIAAFFVNAFLEAKAMGLDFVASVYEALLKLANMLNSVLGIFGIEIDVSGLEGKITSIRDKAQSTRDQKLEYKDVGEAMSNAYSTTYSAVKGFAGADIGAINEGYNKSYSAVGKVGNSARGAVTGAANALVPDELVNPLDWYKNGKAWGDGLGDRLGGWLDSNGNGSGILDSFGASGGVGNAGIEDLLAGMQDPLANAAKGAGGSAASTKKMADSMDLLSDDLEYLRDIAEQEIINRYTGVTFNVGGITTQYNGEESLDGIVTIIDKELRQALMVSAEGVHG